MSSITTVLDTNALPNGCGCSYCQHGHGHDSFQSHDDNALKDLAILSGGGSTVTPISIGQNNAAELISGLEWGPGGGTAVNLSYSFLASTPNYYASTAQERQDFSSFTTDMQSAVRAVMQDIETFTNITFTEVGGVGDITFGLANLTTADSSPLAWGYYPDQGNHGGDVWFNNSYNFSSAMGAGDIGYLIAMHEVGHALGLIHSFSAGLTGNEDSEKFSVMSYSLYPWGNVTAESYMLYDISALQDIYGANTAYNNTDTTYVLDPWSAYTIWDGGGKDTLDSRAFSADTILHLEQGGFSSLGLDEHIAIAYGSVIENAVSGAGNDTIYGNDSNNFLRSGAGLDTVYGGYGKDQLDGGAGADTLDGGAGWDTARYQESTLGVIVNLDTGINHGGYAQGDILVDIEAVAGSFYDDVITGDSGTNYIRGEAGNDVLDGGGGNDVLDGGAGNDTFFYHSGAVSIIESGLDYDRVQFDTQWAPDDVTVLDNQIIFNAGASIQFNDITLVEGFLFDGFSEMNIDGLASYESHNISAEENDDFLASAALEVFSGGIGVDTVSYEGSTSGVRIDLYNNIGRGGDAEGDTFVSIENIVGSDHRDWLWGDMTSNHLYGGAGNDILEGGLVADTLDGGDGWDYARYTRSDEAVQVNLKTGIHTGGDAQGDTLKGIEAIVGSIYGDSLIGSNNGDYLNGERGNDVLSGGLGADVLYGGADADAFIFNAEDLTTNNDYVKDFDASEGDIIDISDIISDYNRLSDVITDFVQITDDGTDTYIAIDHDGGANAFATIAILENVTGLGDAEFLENAGYLITV